MTASSLNDLRNGAPLRDPADEKMEQVRELLFGEHMRHSETRIAQLEAHVRDLEATAFRRLDALAARIEALAGEIHADRRADIDEISRGVVDLGERIRRLTRP